MKKVYNRKKADMQTAGKFNRSLSIILTIMGKDILDAVRNKTILSLLVSALILSAFFTIMPLLSETSTPLVFLVDAGDSSYTALITGSDALRIRLFPSVDEMKADFIQRADQQLDLVLPLDFDQTLATGGIPQIQGYALNWVGSKTIAEKKADVQTRLAGIIGSPVQIDMNGGTLYMSPESNGGMLEATGITVILLTTGMLLVPNLFLEEKRSRTMEALLVSPANSNQIAISKTLTGVFYVSIFAILVVAANAYLVLQWDVVVWSILLSILVAVSIGLLLGILIENRQQITIVAQVLLIPLILPILLRIFSDLLPGWLTNIVRWMPSVVMYDLLRISFSNQFDPGQILPRLGILLISFITLFGVSAWLIQRVER
jgi:ABC-type multidrug transport system permease subunit